ncbi:MAG: glycosyltransferase family 2 protein, partial [Brachybacterium sp.]|nr:glycosyltransferase family 2 protein [Brachybacterium sp.]
MSAAGPLTAHRPERVAVVIPAKNEAERIEATIESARQITGVDLVVVIDDGSTDATSAVAMGAGALVVRHKSNRGKAAAMATGAQLVAIREGAERADGGDDFSEELHSEPRAPGHTGPLPVIDPSDTVPRALLFLDADMADSAEAAQPLVDAVLGEGVDMAIALLPPQAGAGGMGVVVRTARRGIQRTTGWEPSQPLSGTRCITRETWEACLPLAPGWGVETSLSIDALTAGFWVKEIPAQLRHRATGKDLRGQLHRAAQLRDVVRALARKRHLARDLVEGELEDPELSEAERSSLEEPEERPLPTGPADHDREKTWTVVPEKDLEAAADRAEDRRAPLVDLPVDGEFSDDQTRALGDVDVAELDRLLRDLPVEGGFAPDDIVFLAGT